MSIKSVLFVASKMRSYGLASFRRPFEKRGIMVHVVHDFDEVEAVLKANEISVLVIHGDGAIFSTALNESKIKLPPIVYHYTPGRDEMPNLSVKDPNNSRHIRLLTNDSPAELYNLAKEFESK